MTLFQATILSLTQGITEFLPISSTGHLHLIQHFLNLPTSLSLDIFLNTASLLSVIYFFRKETRFFFSNLQYIIAGTLPAVIVGLFFKDQIETLFADNSLLWVQFLFSGLTLLSIKFLKIKDQRISYGKALIIGCFQALGIIPAISRSGSTIFGGLLFGLSPLSAFSFSFSLFIPASVGALLLDIKNIANLDVLSFNYIFAFLLTFVIGIIALSFLKKILISRHFWLFGIYMIAMSALSFLNF